VKIDVFAVVCWSRYIGPLRHYCDEACMCYGICDCRHTRVSNVPRAISRIGRTKIYSSGINGAVLIFVLA